MVSANVDERVLFVGQMVFSNEQGMWVFRVQTSARSGLFEVTGEVDEDQVYLGPEGSESETLHLLALGEESGEAGVFL